MKSLLLVCLIGLSILACSLGGLQSATQAQTPTESANLPVQASLPGLSADQLMNMQVQLVATDPHSNVQLTNGEYHAGTAPLSTDFADVRLVPDQIAFGDLNGDGIQDAAALLSENYGGTGVFVSVIAVLDAGGKPVQAGAVMIDDRPKVTSLQIRDRRIVFSGAIHGPSDPACCASEPVTETFGLSKSGLLLLKLVSSAGGGTERRIAIQSPADGSQVTPGIVQVSGSVSEAPFENALKYRAYGATGKDWAQGTLPVSAGTFAGQVDLSAVPPGIVIRMEVSDISAADGSVIALDSIEVIVK